MVNLNGVKRGAVLKCGKGREVGHYPKTCENTVLCDFGLKRLYYCKPKSSHLIIISTIFSTNANRKYTQKLEFTNIFIKVIVHPEPLLMCLDHVTFITEQVRQRNPKVQESTNIYIFYKNNKTI